MQGPRGGVLLQGRIVAVVALVALLAGCGSGNSYPNADKSADVLIPKAFHALRNARSFWISVDLRQPHSHVTAVAHFGRAASNGELSKGPRRFEFR